jgi:hypothetical protein
LILTAVGAKTEDIAIERQFCAPLNIKPIVSGTRYFLIEEKVSRIT